MLYVHKIKKILNITACENRSEIVEYEYFQISIADTSSQSTMKSRVSLPSGVFLKSTRTGEYTLE